MSGTNPTRRNLLQRLAANHGLKLASLVIGILAGIVAIVAGAWEVADRMNHDTASAKPSAGAASQLQFRPPLRRDHLPDLR